VGRYLSKTVQFSSYPPHLRNNRKPHSIISLTRTLPSLLSALLHITPHHSAQPPTLHACTVWLGYFSSAGCVCIGSLLLRKAKKPFAPYRGKTGKSNFSTLTTPSASYAPRQSLAHQLSSMSFYHYAAPRFSCCAPHTPRPRSCSDQSVMNLSNRYSINNNTQIVCVSQVGHNSE